MSKILADGNEDLVAWMVGANYPVSNGVYDLQAEYGIQSVVGGISYSVLFSNPNDYPYYNRLGMLSSH